MKYLRLLLASVLVGLLATPAFAVQPVYGLLWYGQSLAQGAYGLPLIDYAAPNPSNLFMLDSTGGTSCGTGESLLPDINQGATTASATSCWTGFQPAYAVWVSVAASSSTTAGESPALSMGRVLSTLKNSSTASPYLMLAADFGIGGYAYSQLAQGTGPYNTALNGITKSGTLLGANYALNVPAINFVQGEADVIAGTARATYAGDLNTIQGNLQTDIQAITSQANALPLLISQQTNGTAFTGTLANAQHIFGGQWDAAVAHPSTIEIVEPLYNLENNPVPADSGHLTAKGYFEYGEYAARAYYKTIPIAQGGLGTGWSAPMPTTASIANSGSVVTIPFTGGTQPYVLDCTQVGSPNGAADGFFYTDSSGSPPTISSVAVCGGGRSICLTLSGTPSHAVTGTVEYAWSTTNGEGTSTPGPFTGLRGCMHDSDAYTSILDGKPLPVYSIAWNATFTTN